MKKILVIMLAIALATALFAGCQNTTEQTTEPDGTTKPGTSGNTTAATTATTGEASLVNVDSIFPVANEPVKMSILLRTNVDSAEPQDIWFWQYFERKTNVSWDYVTVLDTAWNERKTVMMASGEYPDVILISGAFTNNEIAEYGADGTFIALNDLIDAYAPNLTGMFAKYPEARTIMTCPDNNIYSLAKIAPTYLGSYGANINQEWLDKADLALPTTLAEFKDVLTAFKEMGDVNADGLDNEWAWSGTWENNSNRAVILNALGFVTNGSFDPGVAIKDDSALYFPLQDSYYEYLTYVKDLYDAELLNPNVFTMDDTEFQAQGQLRTVGFMAAQPRYYTADGYWANYTYIRPLVQNQGDKPVLWKGTEVNSFTFSITDACEYPEVAMNWIDVFYDPYYACAAGYGPVTTDAEEMEGWADFEEATLGHYLVEEPFDSSKYTDTLGQLKDGDTITRLTFTNPETGINNIPDGLNSVQWRNKWMLPWASANIFMLGDEYFYTQLGYAITVYSKDDLGTVESVWRSTFVQNAKEFQVQGYPSIYFYSESDTKWISDNLTLINDYAAQMEAKFITGAEALTPDSFAVYQQQLKELGAEQYQQILYDYYENYKTK